MRYTHINWRFVIQIYNTEFPNINRGDICVTLDTTYLYICFITTHSDDYILNYLCLT